MIDASSSTSTSVSPSGSKIVPVLVILLVVASFFIGSLYTQVNLLKKGSVAGVGTQIAAASNPPAGNLGGGPPQFGSADQVEKLKPEDHVRGSRNARILLIEYSDLECPYCKRFHPTAQQAVDEYKGQVAWVYRHFPLDQIHSKADKEAESIECAYKLGKDEAFWKLTDKIFEVTPSNNGFKLDDLPQLASAVGLDQNKFKSCLDGGEMAKHVEEDYQGGVKAGITGTPGNILLDTKTDKTSLVPGAVPYEQLKQAIDTLLTQS